MRIWATTLGCVLIACSVGAQPIHQHPQKAFYASPAEWPTISEDCWWEAPGSGALPGPSHIGHMTLTLPVGAETSGELITGRFAITTFNAFGRVTSIFGDRVVSWTLDGGRTLPLTTSPDGVSTWTGTVTFSTANTPPRGYYRVMLGFKTELDNKDFTYTENFKSFYSMRDPAAPDTGWYNQNNGRCRVFDASTPTLERWGQHITEFQSVMPLLGPISSYFPWTNTVSAYGYGGSGPLAEGKFVLRLDPNFHEGDPGTVLDEVAGNKIDRAITLPASIPDGPHRLMYQWIRADPAGTRVLTSNTVINVVVGPGGVAQFPVGTPTPTPEPGHTTSPPPPPPPATVSPLSITTSTLTPVIGQPYTVTATIDLTLGNVYRLHLDGNGGGTTCTATACSKTAKYVAKAGTVTHEATAFKTSDGTAWPVARLTVTGR